MCVCACSGVFISVWDVCVCVCWMYVCVCVHVFICGFSGEALCSHVWWVWALQTHWGLCTVWLLQGHEEVWRSQQDQAEVSPEAVRCPGKGECPSSPMTHITTWGHFQVSMPMWWDYSKAGTLLQPWQMHQISIRSTKKKPGMLYIICFPWISC